MKQQEIKDFEMNEIQINGYINYSLDDNKQSLIKHSSNGITTDLKSYKGYQTITKSKPIIQNKIMNYYILFDIMAEIANQINTKDSNLRMCAISFDQSIQQKQIQFQLVYAITFEYGFQIREQEIDKAIIQISTQIDEICVETYDKGDINLTQQVDRLFEQYQEILN